MASCMACQFRDKKNFAIRNSTLCTQIIPYNKILGVLMYLSTGSLNQEGVQYYQHSKQG